MASEKRIKDFEPASDIELDDWFAIDSPSVGTRKVQLAQMLEAIQTQVTAIADELAVLDGEVDTHDTNISNLQTKVGTAVLETEAQDLSGGVNELNSHLIVLSPTTAVTITTITSSSTERDFTVQTDGFYNFYSVANSNVQANIKLSNSNGDTLWIGQNKDNDQRILVSSPIFYLKAGTYKLTMEGTNCGYRQYTL